MTTVSSDKINNIPFSKEKNSQECQVGSLNQYHFEKWEGEGVKETFEFLVKINSQETETPPSLLLQGMESVYELMLLQERSLEEMKILVEEHAIAPEEVEIEECIKCCNKGPAKHHERSLPKEQSTSTHGPLFHKDKDVTEQRAAFSKKMQATEMNKAPFFMVTAKKSEAEKERPDRHAVKNPTVPSFEKKENSLSHDKKPEERLFERTSVFSLHSQMNQERKREKEHSGQQQQGQEEREQKEKEKREKERKGPSKVKGILSGATQEIDESKEEIPPSLLPIGDIFTRFIALMARILGQAQAEAHMLYQRIKERTDNVDTLTTLLAKLNNTNNKKLDWSKDPEMRALVDKARALGVEIPEGKYTWTDEEKRHLKENIQMRKDTLEKITQLERTDMQRFMQEVSQCHQARSNVLKMIKEIADTIIANLRGH